jgi:hypothetical protein
MEDYLKFRKMITPVIIQVIYWIGTILIILTGLYYVFLGITADFQGGKQVLCGLLLMFLGPLGVRIYCELLILLFRMKETMDEMLEQLKKKK